jgi:phage terminase large subunit-like protein
MPKKATGPIDTIDAFRSIGEELKVRAQFPNIHGYMPHYRQSDFHSCGEFKPPKGHRGIDTNLISFAFREQIKKIRLYIGGNRSGKTVGGIVEDIWWVTKTHPYIDIEAIWPEPIRGRIVTTDFAKGWHEIIRPVLARWVPLSYLKGNSWTTAWDETNKILTFANGGTIEIMTHEQDLEKFAGTSRHFIHFDEECSQEIYKECLARLIDTGGCAWMTMTPVEGMTWVFDTLYEKGLDNDDPQIYVVEVDMDDNPYISESEKDNFVSLLDEDEVKTRVHGRFVRKGGLVYPDFSESLHVIEPCIPPKDYLWVCSMDQGLKNPTSFHWSAINYEGRIITFWEHYKSGWVVAEHATEVHKINNQFDRKPDYYVGDPSIRNRNPISGSSVFEEYVKYNIVIMHDDHLNDVNAGINKFSTYLRTVDVDFDGTETPYWLVTKNCDMLQWEIKRYRWRTFVSKKAEANNNPIEAPVKKDDHALDDIRYMIMSRPDLKAIREAKLPPWQHNEIQAAKIYSSTDERRNVDMDSGAAPDAQWNKEYAAPPNQTEWEFEEVMGGDW